MVADKNKGPLFIMWHLVYFFMPDKDQEEPGIGPNHTNTEHHVAALYPAKQPGDECKREQDQHDHHKGNSSIDGVYGFDKLQK